MLLQSQRKVQRIGLTMTPRMIVNVMLLMFQEQSLPLRVSRVSDVVSHTQMYSFLVDYLTSNFLQ